MKHFFPNQGRYIQTNRSDRLGSLWSSFNLDFQTNLGTMRLANKLVTNTTSSDDADLGLPVAFEYWDRKWWTIGGTRVFKNSSNDLTTSFTEETGVGYTIGDGTSQFDVTNTSGTTMRYTWDGTGLNPGITATNFPNGSSIEIDSSTNFNVNNRGTFTITGSGTNYFEVTNAAGVVESNKTIGSGFIILTGGNFGIDCSLIGSDLKVFKDNLWLATSQHLYRRQSESVPWVNITPLVGTTSIHQLCYFHKFDRLYVIKQNPGIISVDTTYVAAAAGDDYTITLDSSIGSISSMVASSNYIWIGTHRDITNVIPASNQLNGVICQWDGFSSTVLNQYDLENGGVLAMCIVNDVPYALDTEGRILKYTGYSFQELARFPIDRTLLLNATALNVSKFIHFNGMTGTKNNTILISLNNLNEDNDSDINENLPSGIWELDLSSGSLTHKYSPTLKARSSSTITDYGQNRISLSGALKLNYLQSDASNGRSTLIAGYNYYTDATTIKSGIYIDSPAKASTDNEGQKHGYFVTTWMESAEATDTWTRLWAVYRRFLNSTDKIIFKYRLAEVAPVEATITWTSTTTFTTPTDVSAYDPSQSPFDGTTGGEVEVLQGTGSGSCTHISSVVFGGGLYTVTLDTAVTGVTGTAKARFQKWIKCSPELTGQVLSYGSVPITQNDARIQIKGVLQWTGNDELYKMVLFSNQDVNITA